MAAPLLSLVLPHVFGMARDALDRALPDPEARARAEVELLKAQADGTFAQRAEMALQLAQVEVNKVEAASSGIWRGGWRPAVGWVCVGGLGVQCLAAPLLPWAVRALTGAEVEPLPLIDGELLFSLLAGLLGLGTLRTVERVKGRA